MTQSRKSPIWAVVAAAVLVNGYSIGHRYLWHPHEPVAGVTDHAGEPIRYAEVTNIDNVFVGEPCYFKIPITNLSPVPVAIELTETSCGCTTAVMAKQKIEAGETSRLTGKIRSPKRPEKVVVYLDVRSVQADSHAAQRHRLQVTADFKSLVSLDYRVSEGKSGACQWRVRVTNDYKSNIKVQLVSTGSDATLVQPEKYVELPPNAVGTFDVTNTDQQVSNVQIIVNGGAEYRNLHLRSQFTLEELVEIHPRVLVLGNVHCESGKTVVQRPASFTVGVPENRTIGNLVVTDAPPFLANSNITQQDHSVTALFDVDATDPSIPLRGVIRFTIDVDGIRVDKSVPVLGVRSHPMVNVVDRAAAHQPAIKND